MATIKANSSRGLLPFLQKLVELNESGQFVDVTKLQPSFFPKETTMSMPLVDIETSTTAPKASDKLSTTGDLLYSKVFPQTLPQFLGDFQASVANGGSQSGKSIKKFSFISSKDRPYITVNVEFEGAKVVDITVKSSDVKVTFSGEDKSGTASATSPKNTTVKLDKTSGLTNGDSVVATVTANSGYTVNGKGSDTFTYTVSGLTEVSTPTDQTNGG